MLNRRQFLLPVFLFCALCCAPLALSQTANDSTAPADATPAKSPTFLKGGVHHKEFVNPVEATLRTGAKYDDASLTPLTPQNVWIPIPDWLAGLWQYKTENVTDMTNYTNISYTPAPYTIRNESKKVMGQQKDKSGQIWHYLKAPYSYLSKLDHGNVGHERVLTADALKCEADEVDLRLYGTSTIVNPHSGRVVETDQSEDFNNYTKDKNGMVCGGSSKHFDMDGKPTMQMASYMKAKLVKPFAVLDVQDGENLRRLFIEFLTTHGKAALIPDAQPDSSLPAMGAPY